MHVGAAASVVMRNCRSIGEKLQSLARRGGGLMMKCDRSIVHIGFHKTGTTSIQSFLWQQRERLAARGIVFFEGQHIPSNHVELHTAALRQERITPFKLRQGVTGGPDYRSSVEHRLARFYAEQAGDTVLFSAEGLSYVRWPDELSWLRSVLVGRVTIIAYLRNVVSYESAYRYSLDANRMPPSEDRQSVAYVAPDSWLWDYEMRLRPFREAFGDENVIVRNYDSETAQDGSVIPSMLRVLDIEDLFAPAEWKGLRLNQSPKRRFA